MTGAVIAACGQMMKRRRERRAAEAEAEAQAQAQAPALAPANHAPAPAPANCASASHAPAPAPAPAPTPANCASANHAPALARAAGAGPSPTSNPLPPAPRPIQHDSVTSQAVPVSNNIVDACGFHFKAFKGCLNSHVDDISKCQVYVGMLKECRKNSGFVFGF
ncbi:hypothetical protein Cgig2_019576 [Carnegiea gigantea]|uniref:CHCH domain-containing protein n=1 Tax=Carnegiea gigantea TaxID=171969 RepID=A0A9Q1QJ08_9CARY|nr:hypothetical protein Cgig2_019576 [Carnegiea gigantea]